MAIFNDKIKKKNIEFKIAIENSPLFPHVIWRFRLAVRGFCRSQMTKIRFAAFQKSPSKVNSMKKRKENFV